MEEFFSAQDTGDACPSGACRITVESVIEAYGPYIYNLALRLTANTEAAKDLAQETFIKAWLHIKELRNTAAIKKWLRTICINEFRMQLRKQQKEHLDFVGNMEELEYEGRLLPAPLPGPFEEIAATEETIKMRNGCFLAMTTKLSPNQRIVFSLVDMFGLSLGEVSGILGCTQKAAKGLLYRARLNLETFFQGHCSFFDLENSCRCAAWVDFVNEREHMRKKMRQTISKLNYAPEDYVYNPQAYQRLLYYYNHLPEYRPGQEWYDTVIELVKNFYQEMT